MDDHTATVINAPFAGTTTADGINDHNSVVGFQGNVGFVESNGTYRSIIDPKEDGGGQAHAMSIDNAADVVGSYTTNVGWVGFIYNPNTGTFTDIKDPLDTNNYTVVNGMSPKGDYITGTYEDSTGNHAFVEHNGVFTTLTPPGSIATFGQGVNDKGQVVGFYDAAGGVEHGFLASDPLPPARHPCTSTYISRSITGRTTSSTTDSTSDRELDPNPKLCAHFFT